MAIGRPQHEIYRRRGSRNKAMLFTMLGLVALIFAVTVAKIQDGHLMEAFDHTYRASALPPIEE